MAILPPGMHQAFTSSELITWISQGHWAASGRKAPTCATNLLVMVRTRCTCAAFTSSALAARASAIICEYCLSAACCNCAGGTEAAMNCFRSTPTVPLWVVCTEAQPVRATSAATPLARSRRFPLVRILFISVPCSEDGSSAAPALSAMTQRMIHEHDGKQRLGDRRGADAHARIVPAECLDGGGLALDRHGTSLHANARRGLDRQ